MSAIFEKTHRSLLFSPKYSETLASVVSLAGSRGPLGPSPDVTAFSEDAEDGSVVRGPE